MVQGENDGGARVSGGTGAHAQTLEASLHVLGQLEPCPCLDAGDENHFCSAVQYST